jgi:hypothetical protein
MDKFLFVLKYIGTSLLSGLLYVLVSVCVIILGLCALVAIGEFSVVPLHKETAPYEQSKAKEAAARTDCWHRCEGNDPATQCNGPCYDPHSDAASLN